MYNDDNTTSSLIPTKNEIIGILICAFAVVLFLYGPSMYALESNLLSFVIFGIGATMLLFGFKILKQIGFAFVLLGFFIPIPLEFINLFVSMFNPITAQLVQMILNISGTISTLDVIGMLQIVANFYLILYSGNIIFW